MKGVISIEGQFLSEIDLNDRGYPEGNEAVRIKELVASKLKEIGLFNARLTLEYQGNRFDIKVHPGK